MTGRTNVAMLVAGILLISGIWAQGAEIEQGELEKLAPHMVKVEYHLQYHHGDKPQAPGWIEQCPNCGRYHINSAASALREERPVQIPGILLSPREVIVPDPMVHPRFVDKITVVRGNERRQARISGYATDEPAVMLEFDKPFSDVKELAFKGKVEAPYFAVTYRDVEGRWILRSAPINTTPGVSDTGKLLVSVPAPSLIVDADGEPVSVAMRIQMPAKGWKTPPTAWEWLSSQKRKKELEDVSKIANSSVVRVKLNFRDPVNKRKTTGYHHRGRDEAPTEMGTLGLVLRDGRLLVLAELPPRTTARLKRIQAFFPGGKVVEGDFTASLEDYGMMIARLVKVPEGAGVKLRFVDDADKQALRHLWLPAAVVKVAGNQRVSRMDHIRINTMERGWRQQLIPKVRKRAEKLFLFDRTGRLLLLPVSRRDKTVGSGRSYRSRSEKLPTWAGYLKPVLKNVAAHSDRANVPLSEEEQGRLAWLGVELQKLTKEMAEMSGVTDEVDSYRGSGALVAYVYPESPAAEAGIKSGMVLMRLRLPGQTEPIRVEAPSERFGGRPFPWDKLDQVPDQYLNRIPQPWPPAASKFNQTLTDLGIGKTVIAEIIHDGERMEKKFVIKEGPTHYGNAAKHSADKLGLTVRNLTYEVRRFFRRPEGKPGIIISRVEPGGRAATAGLKPYEIITHVNDVAVSSIEEWKKAIKGHRKLKLSVRRMAQGRVARITLPEKEKEEKE